MKQCLVPENFKVGDPVFHGEPSVLYYITSIDRIHKSADLKATNGKSLVIHHNVAWSELRHADKV